MNIRQYLPEEYDMLKSWWDGRKEPGPTPGMLSDSTFILEDRGTPVMSISVYLTNAKDVGYLENFIKNPDYEDSHLASKKIVEFAEKFARDNGVKYLMCLSYRDKLKSRYSSLGYTNTLNNLSSFVKEL